jgi:predicted DNA-binding transcriptional regulator AlpA
MSENRKIEVIKLIEEPLALLSVEQTAARLGISPQTIYNGISRKAKTKFPVKFKRYGKKPLFTNKDIQAFIERLPYED